MREITQAQSLLVVPGGNEDGRRLAQLQAANQLAGTPVLAGPMALLGGRAAHGTQGTQGAQGTQGMPTLARPCSACGKALPPGGRFCSYCGTAAVDEVDLEL